MAKACHMVAGMHTLKTLEDKLAGGLTPVSLEIRDESELHRGHSGAGGGGHFRIRVVSDAFEGKSLVDRHRMIYQLLAEEMAGAVHALALVTLTPAEAIATAQAVRDSSGRSPVVA